MADKTPAAKAAEKTEPDTTLSYFTTDEKAYAHAEEFFERLERQEDEPRSADPDPSGALKSMVTKALRKGEAPVMVSSTWERGTQTLFGVAYHDGQHAQIFYGRAADLKEARKEAFEKAAEHLTKTPLSYHSHLHGKIAEAAAEEEESEE